MNKPVLGVIIGPTAVGKTTISIEVAKRMDAEIISADSIQIYRGMDIGSAKPTIYERKDIPHHLIDIVDIDASFSVAEYQGLAQACIADTYSRGIFPIVSGGTGLYVNSLIFPLDFATIPADEALRSSLNELENTTPGALHDMLRMLDEKAAVRLHRNDRKRLVRAIEICKLTGSTMDSIGGDFANKAKKEIPYEPVIFGLTMQREALYERINTRVDAMMSAGLLCEVRRILENGYDPQLTALQGLGYKQLILYLHGKYTIEEAVNAIKMETRRFAKRQLTWFKRDQRIQWIDMGLISQREAVDIITDAFTIAGR
ncbi:MAG: tRNA (adenosine(37)-N6)-dimethylallyltransferase MiaA [Clostridia bacterium]